MTKINEAARLLGSRGGKKGAAVTNAQLTAGQRKRKSRKAAEARWQKFYADKGMPYVPKKDRPRKKKG